MIIRAYAGLPTTYAPDVGEIVEARRSASERFTRAVVLDVKRRPDGRVRVKVQWLGDDPTAGVTGNFPIKANTVGWVIFKRGPGEPPMIRQIDKGSPTAG